MKEVGRIRIGQRGPKGNPVKLTVFRFTSFDKRAIEKIAELYGGDVRQCTDKELEGQWEVVTTTSELPFMVAPIPPSQFMELWSGGGCQRRCDGQTELLSGKPCMCTPGAEECKPTTRLSLVLPDVPGIGVWRIESHGWNAAQELLPTFEFLLQVSGRGRPAQGLLAIEERRGKVDGKTTKFMVPVIRTEFTPRQLLEASAQSLPSPGSALPEAKPELPPPATNGHTATVLKDPNPRGAFFAIAHEMGWPAHENGAKSVYYSVCGKVIGRDLESLSTVTDDEWHTLAAWLRDVKDGTKKAPNAMRHYLTSQAVADEYDPFGDVPVEGAATEPEGALIP